jgi:hypothetical protein
VLGGELASGVKVHRLHDAALASFRLDIFDLELLTVESLGWN